MPGCAVNMTSSTPCGPTHSSLLKSPSVPPPILFSSHMFFLFGRLYEKHAPFPLDVFLSERFQYAQGRCLDDCLNRAYHNWASCIVSLFGLAYLWFWSSVAAGNGVCCTVCNICTQGTGSCQKDRRRMILYGILITAPLWFVQCVLWHAFHFDEVMLDL
jgi:hypothetical protein